MKKIALFSSLAALLEMSILVAVAMWFEVKDAQISLNGIIAMVAGSILSLGLGIGLMTLVFISARNSDNQHKNLDHHS